MGAQWRELGVAVGRHVGIEREQVLHHDTIHSYRSGASYCPLTDHDQARCNDFDRTLIPKENVSSCAVTFMQECSR